MEYTFKVPDRYLLDHCEDHSPETIKGSGVVTTRSLVKGYVGTVSCSKSRKLQIESFSKIYADYLEDVKKRKALAVPLEENK